MAYAGTFAPEERQRDRLDNGAGDETHEGAALTREGVLVVMLATPGVLLADAAYKRLRATANP